LSINLKEEEEEHRLKVFEKKVLKGILGSKRENVTGISRKVNYEEHRYSDERDM
jgi:hypothetical protein